MYPSKSRIRELRERFGVDNYQVFSNPRYVSLNWYLGNSRRPTDFKNFEWFCYGDIRDDDIDRLRKLLEVDEKLVLGWKGFPHDSGDDSPPHDQDNKIWLYIISFGVMLDKREGWRKDHIFTLDEAGRPVWEKIISTPGR